MKYSEAKILVIEDELNIRESIRDILEFSGYQVITANNGKEGIELAIAEKPDVVLSDIYMPEMDGWETLKAFQNHQLLQQIPFVYLSASSDFRRGMNHGASDFLLKPFDNIELLQVVKNQMRISKRVQQNNQSEDGSDTDHISIDFIAELERAKMIQNTILPTKNEMDDIMKNYFMMYMPKEKVSGDYYWTKYIEGIKLVAIADCTGHGVPAALITMVSSHMLNEAVSHYHLTQPAQILTKVNDLLVEFMKHESGLSDGMDIALCAIDEKNRILTYAGAKSPIYISAKELTAHTPHTVLEEKQINEKTDTKVFRVRGGNYSIGTAVDEFEVIEHQIQFQDGDALYLFSDGIIDQFGGENGKRFKSSRFTQLLNLINDQPMEEQKDIIQMTFNKWKGLHEQVDDVSLLGIRL